MGNEPTQPYMLPSRRNLLIIFAQPYQFHSLSRAQNLNTPNLDIFSSIARNGHQDLNNGPLGIQNANIEMIDFQRADTVDRQVELRETVVGH